MVPKSGSIVRIRNRDSVHRDNDQPWRQERRTEHQAPYQSLIMPPPRRGGALSGHRRPSSVRPSVCLSVCLMSRTSALTRKPKGLGRRNFAQEYPRSHVTPTPTSRTKGQKSRSAGAVAYCGGHLAAQLVQSVGQ